MDFNCQRSSHRDRLGFVSLVYAPQSIQRFKEGQRALFRSDSMALIHNVFAQTSLCCKAIN